MVYNLREFDERPYFDQYAEKYGIRIVSTAESPTLENADLAKGCRFVNVITTPIQRPLLERFHALGVRYLVTRTIGYDHIDTKAAQELGIQIANTPYGPDGVAEYTILLMLMCIRKMRSIQHRFKGQDYTLKGLLGRELSDMTVGVIGTGRIGTRLIQMLTGFGCKVLAYSPHPNETAAQHATYCSLETLLRDSDLITLHAPATDATWHMLDASAFSSMKDGVVLINTARGALIDTPALVEALRSGKLAGAALDTYENEASIFNHDLEGQEIEDETFKELIKLDNVVVSPHIAFYTNVAVENMVKISLDSAKEVIETGTSSTLVK